MVEGNEGIRKNFSGSPLFCMWMTVSWLYCEGKNNKSNEEGRGKKKWSSFLGTIEERRKEGEECGGYVCEMNEKLGMGGDNCEQAEGEKERRGGKGRKKQLRDKQRGKKIKTRLSLL